ncbi:MAG TPA: CBS domain-containing protein [Acidimicrobiales bacterium]|nr:CBS domain-containing protein [Acidimicrobiales bacterium]
MKVRDVMTAPPITIRPDATFGEAVDLLLEHDISGLPVVDAEGMLVGIVTEADLLSKEAYAPGEHRPLGLVAEYLRGHDPQWVRKAAGRRVGDIMTPSPSRVAPADDLRSAARTMLEAGHKRLPVVEDGRVVGIVSRHDLLRPFHRTDEEIAAEVDRILASPMCAPEGHACAVIVDGGVVTLTGTTRRPSDANVIAAIVDRVAGVIAVDNRLIAREREPHAGRA